MNYDISMSREYYLQLGYERDELQARIDKAIEKLKEHKVDLDYEPWSFYEVDGNILFDLVNILEGSDSNDK